MNGETIEQRLQCGPMHPAAAIEIATQVLSASSYAHERGIIHRDIKPANIMVTAAGVVKLTDFGIASGAAGRRLTQTGFAIGSLHYMSPGQIKALTVDGRSHIDSLGVALYETVTSRHAFEGPSDFDLMRAHLEQEAIPASSYNPNVLSTLSAVIARAMAKCSEDRFQTAGEFLQTLKLIRSTGIPAVPATDPAAFPLARPLTPAPSPSGAMSSGTPPPLGWDQALLERIRNELALFVGPAARVLVNRAAKKTQNVDQLYESLGSEIPSSEERQKFMLSRRRLTA